MKLCTFWIGIGLVFSTQVFSAQTEISESAESESSSFDDRLLGDVWGLRTKMDSVGLDLTIAQKSDFYRNMDGGVKKQNAFLGHTDLVMSWDLERGLGVPGMSMQVWGIIDYGRKFSEKVVGDSQVVSNIEAPTTARLFEAWLQQDFLDGQLSLLGGIRDINQEFYVTDASGLFLNSSFGIGKEFSQVTPSIVPITALGGRVGVKVEPAYLLTAIFDGVPGDPEDPKAHEYSIKNSEGALVISEAGIEMGEQWASKFGIGGWAYTRSFPHVVSGADHKNWGGLFHRQSNSG